MKKRQAVKIQRYMDSYREDILVSHFAATCQVNPARIAEALSMINGYVPEKAAIAAAEYNQSIEDSE